MREENLTGLAGLITIKGGAGGMARRKRRIDCKLHRWFLHLGVIDASLDRDWRRRLFAAPPGQLFHIDAQQTDGFPKAVARGIRRYRLKYTACRVESAPPPFNKVCFEGCVWFRFQARDYPEIVSYSANNPET